jgi:hypothetical protein
VRLSCNSSMLGTFEVRKGPPSAIKGLRGECQTFSIRFVLMFLAQSGKQRTGNGRLVNNNVVLPVSAIISPG